MTNEAVREHIDRKLARLVAVLTDMATNDMGDLSVAEAACFHTACDAIDNLIEARSSRLDDGEETA